MSTTTTPIQGRKADRRIKTPDSGGVIPFLSIETPPGKVVRSYGKKKSPQKVAAGRESFGIEVEDNTAASVGGGQRIRQTRARRRGAAISPRTRGSAIASILASPGEFAANNTGTKHKFVSPSKRSSAEATLHYVARAATKGTKRSLDNKNSPPMQGKRRRRKAASVANDKVRGICQMDDFDDLIDTGKIPYNKPNRRENKAVSDLVVGETVQSVVSSSNHARPITVDTFEPRGKVEERWFRNFKKWTCSQQQPSTQTTTLSPMPKRWAKDQRAQYRLLHQNKKSQMTQDRISLLESAGFCWEVRNAKPRTGSKNDVRSNVSGKVPAMATNANIGVRDKAEEQSASLAEPKQIGNTDSPSKRKSPRKSLPTQFYHNLASTDERNGGLKSRADIAKQTKPTAKKQLQMSTDPKVTAPASTTGTTSKKQSSPSKSRAVSTPKESLASLSADANAKAKSEKQKEGKKRKRRGRRSTSSLSALEVTKDTSPEEGKSDIFSHRELEKELSKKQKRTRKKPENGEAKKNAAKDSKSQSTINDTANSENAGANSSSSAATTADATQPSDRNVDMNGAKRNDDDASATVDKSSWCPSTPQSTLLVTKLPPSSVDDIAPTQKSTDDLPESVCVTKLLLSCLSEDSAEKESKSSQVASPLKVGIKSPVKPTIPKGASEHTVPCPEIGEGWSQKIVARKKVTGGSKASDRYFFSPDGKKFRSFTEVTRYLSGNVESPAKASVESPASSPSQTVNRKSNDTSVSTSPSTKQATRNEDDDEARPTGIGGPPSQEKEADPLVEHSAEETVANEEAVETNEKHLTGHEAASNEADVEKQAQQQLEPAGSLSEPTSWTCDICQEATFTKYDEAVAHEKKCAGTGDVHDEVSRRENDSSVKGNVAEQPTPPRKENEQPNSWTCDICQKATFTNYDEAVAHEKICATTINSHSERINNEEGEVEAPEKPIPESVANQDDSSQPTPAHQRNKVGESASLSLCSPSSLTSPLQANNLLETSYQDSTAKTLGTTAELTTPSSLSLVSHSQNLNVALPAGTQVSEPQLQMILAEKQYQEKMAEFGRLELEAKMVTKRMREIEDRIQDIDSNTVANGTNGSNRIEEYKSVSRSYRSESKSQSWSHRYESSEGEDSEVYYSPRKRKQTHDEIESDMRSGKRSRRSEQRYERSVKRVNVSSRSGRQEGGNSEIHMKSSPRKPKKVDRHRAERFVEGYDDDVEQIGYGYHPPSAKKKSRTRASPKGKTKATSTSPRKSLSSKRKRKSPHHAASNKDEASPRKPTPREADEYPEQESLSVKSHDQQSESDGYEQPVDSERSKQTNVAMINEPTEEKDPPAASTKQSAVAKDNATTATENALLNTEKNEEAQVNRAKDPLFWLAGGENSSDDESWDFDGPMILPPPPM